MKKRFLVLTTSIGNKDILVDPPIIFDSCDYIAIVDKPFINIKIWTQLQYYNFSSIDKYKNRRDAKLYKILSSILFSEYEYIIWQDGNHCLVMDPINIINEYGDADYYLIPHPIRDCIYSEIDIVKAYGLDDNNILDKQKCYYEKLNFPKNYGLYMMGIHIKKVGFSISNLDFTWWEQICKFSSRDQCSFSFALWHQRNLGNDIKVKTLTCKKENILVDNPYFKTLKNRNF